MNLKIACPSYANRSFGDVPCLDASAVLSEDGSSLSLFCVNRANEAMELDLRAAGFEGLRLVEAVELKNPDLLATNTAASPDRVAPRSLSVAKGPLALAPLSYTVLRYALDVK